VACLKNIAVLLRLMHTRDPFDW